MKVAAVIVFAVIAVGVGTAFFVTHRPAPKEVHMEPKNFQISSPAFADNTAIPTKYTCNGDNVSPPLDFKDLPDNTASLAIIMHDPDAPGGDFTHWTVWNISPGTTNFEEN